MPRNARHSLLALLLPLSALLLPACLSTGVRSSGSALPQAGTTFSDGQLKVDVDHNCGKRCESLTAKFENTTASQIEILVGQARLKRGAEKFALKRIDGVCRTSCQKPYGVRSRLILNAKRQSKPMPSVRVMREDILPFTKRLRVG
jgi:hypothetical protein